MEAPEELVSKHTRIKKRVTSTQIRDKKLRSLLEEREAEYEEAGRQAAQVDAMLLPQQAGEISSAQQDASLRLTQHYIKQAVDVQSAQKSFNLLLDQFGPYRSTYSRSGRYMALAGSKGHCAIMDWQAKRLLSEWHVRDSAYDVCFLHNQTWCAVAQEKALYIYDNQGVELHELRDHAAPRHLEFLPYHWLLVSGGETGWLRWLDVSMGKPVSEKNTRFGPTQSLCQNPWNAVIVAGHARGSVSMWTPNMGKPVVTLLAHRGPVTSVAVDRGGHHLVTAGLDGQVHVWDVRRYQKLHSYFSKVPASAMDISDRGVLALAQGNSVLMWKDGLATKQKKPYMRFSTDTHTAVSSVAFCPFEDVLGVGHAGGFSSILVPGSGEPNFDSREANPYETRKQRREAEVKSLLDKLQPETITVDPTVIGGVAQGTLEPEAAEEAAKFQAKRKGKGKSKIGSIQARKRKVHWEEQAREEKARVVAEIEEQRRNKSDQGGAAADEDDWTPLARFKKKAGY